MTRALLFVADQDTPGKKDVTHAFMPGARAFARSLGVEPADSIVRFPAFAPIDQRRATCTLAIKTRPLPLLDVVGFFCHGWPHGLQAGFIRQHALLLARLLAIHAKPDAHVVLYACAAGADNDRDPLNERAPGVGGDGGFADGLRDACEALGRRITVMAHSTVGHALWNPYARFFAPGQGGKGGRWYVEPKSELWPLWVSALRDPRSDLVYRFYRMSRSEIERELRAPKGTPPLVA